MNKNRLSLIDGLANFVVDRRKLIFFLYSLLVVFSLFAMQWVTVEDDIINYLDQESNTRRGLEIMNEEFKTLGMADIMVSNVSLERAERLAEAMEAVPGVSILQFDSSPDHYRNSSALFVVQFEEEETDPRTTQALDDIKALVCPYDCSIATSIGTDTASQLNKDMTVVGILAAIVIVIVLIFTSRSYGEIPVLLMTFGIAALANMGTNFMLEKISFISHSVAVVLQLALAIDYAIIMSHRFHEEREKHDPKEAAKRALKKAIKEISSSSLTTIAGLGALAFMRFGIGKDLAFVMIKAILLSMLTVFTLMPGLLVSFSRLIERSKHENFIRQVSALGRFSIKTRYIMPPVFLVVLVAAFIFSNNCPFLFSMNDIKAYQVNETQVAKDRIRQQFGENNTLALIVPSGDYESEKKLLDNLSHYKEVSRAIGLSNTEAIGEHTLTDGLTPRQFAELLDLDLEVGQLLYSAYAISEEAYDRIISGINLYDVPLIDMYQFLYEEVVQGYISIDDEQADVLKEAYQQLSDARVQMEGPRYSRMVLTLDLKEESLETFAFLDTVRREAEQYYDADAIFLIGESSNAMDLAASFDRDNLIISILSAVFIVLILTFTFKSVGLPVLLILVIQASIWINFSFPFLRGEPIYFLGFLIVSSIQMGANIDYAIVMTNRYMTLREKMPLKQAVIEALNQSFPTVITSGTILAVAGILIGFFSTDGATSVLGTYLGQGTIISVILVLFVLPQLLYLGDRVIQKTSFSIPSAEPDAREATHIELDGHVRGYIQGDIDATVRGTIQGDIQPLAQAGPARLDEAGKEADQP